MQRKNKKPSTRDGFRGTPCKTLIIFHPHLGSLVQDGDQLEPDQMDKLLHQYIVSTCSSYIRKYDFFHRICMPGIPAWIPVYKLPWHDYIRLCRLSHDMRVAIRCNPWHLDNPRTVRLGYPVSPNIHRLPGPQVGLRYMHCRMRDTDFEPRSCWTNCPDDSWTEPMRIHPGLWTERRSIASCRNS